MSRADPIASDAAARDRAVLHPGSVLVQAPAGSGKTTLLVRRFLRVLATVDAPDGVLALTFTRRAAHEMRERIIAALAAAERDAPAPDRETVQLARAAVRRFRELGIDLVAQASRLRIETIDAFNGWLAGRLPVGSGLGAIPRVADDATEAYREAARRTLAYAEDDAFGAAVERVLGLFDLRHEWLVDLLVRMLPARQEWLPQLAGGLRASVRDEEAELPAVRRRLEEDLAIQAKRTLANAAAALGPERLAAVVEPLRAAARRAGGAVAALEVWADRETPLRADPQDLAHWRGLAATALTRKGGLRSRLTVAEGFAADSPEKRVMRDWLAEADRDPRTARALADVAALPDLRFEPCGFDPAREPGPVARRERGRERRADPLAAGASVARERCERRGVAERLPERRCAAREREQVGEVEPRPRRAQHAEPRDPVAGVAQRAREQDQVAHRRPLGERRQVERTGRDAARAQRARDLERVRAGAHEHRDALRRVTRLARGDPVGDRGRLALTRLEQRGRDRRRGIGVRRVRRA